jgi:hypothetical protein
MENILSEFSTKELKIKLTNEKLFINTTTSNETIALRSINGIGTVDLVDEYNQELTKWKEQGLKSKDSKTYAYILFVIGGMIVISSILNGDRNSSGGSDSSGGSVLGFVFFAVGYYFYRKKPNLLSSLRIMMSGGNRDFKFDKTSSNSSDIADFVAKVESTLTAFHKNN